MKWNKQIRIVVDSNLYISALLGGKVKEQFSAILSNKNIKIYTCSKQILEIDKVIEKPFFRDKLSIQSIISLKAILKYRVQEIVSISDVNICRDKKDNYLLALCYDCDAHFLLTGDNDLLVIQQFENTQIVNIQEFACL